MKTMKKVASIVIALLLVFSTMSIAANAVGETGQVNITITADKSTNLYPGDIVTFTINIRNNFNYTGMRWPVMYSPKAFEPVIANDGSNPADYGNVKGFGAIVSNDSVLESAELSANSTAFGGTYSKTAYNGLLIQWTAGTSSAGVAYYNEPSGSDCITFQLRVLDAPTATKATVTIPDTAQCKSYFYYQAVSNPSDATTFYKMDATTCTVSISGLINKISLYKEHAGITPKTGTDTIIDPDGYIYGLNDFVTGKVDCIGIDEHGNDNTLEYINLSGGATYTIEPNENDVYSTGAKLHIFDANGKAIGDYEYVVFGDVNGDGMTDGMDIAILVQAYMYEDDWSYGDLKDNSMFFACDINADGVVAPDDFAPLARVLIGDGCLNQTRNPNPSSFILPYYNVK